MRLTFDILSHHLEPRRCSVRLRVYGETHAWSCDLDRHPSGTGICISNSPEAVAQRATQWCRGRQVLCR